MESGYVVTARSGKKYSVRWGGHIWTEDKEKKWDKVADIFVKNEKVM